MTLAILCLFIELSSTALVLLFRLVSDIISKLTYAILCKYRQLIFLLIPLIHIIFIFHLALRALMLIQFVVCRLNLGPISIV